MKSKVQIVAPTAGSLELSSHPPAKKMPGHYAPVPRLCERLLPCCQTCHPISLSVPRSQHSITGGSNTVSLTLTPLSLFLTHSLPFHARRSIISSPPPLNFTSACCLLTTVALSLAGFEAVGLQTSRRPSVRPSEKLLRRSPSSKGRTGGGGGKRKEGEAWKGRSGEGLARAQLWQGI